MADAPTDFGETHELDETVRVSKIENGTVIDHLPSGSALTVLDLLGIDPTAAENTLETTVSVGMHIPSSQLPAKDIVKIENRELDEHEAAVLALIAPTATVNIIRDYEVAAKHRVDRPDVVAGHLTCPNPSCISNTDEPTTATFSVLDDALRCQYCNTNLPDDPATYL